MSASPFDTGLVINRLREQVPALRSVQGAADYAAITGLSDFPAPCAYVVLASESGEGQDAGYAPRGQMVPTSQMVKAAFGVVLVVRNYREQRGAQLKDEMNTMINAVRGALIGYVPDLPGARACQFVRGDLQDYDAATALWVDVYQTQHSIGSQA